jgi:hypothetical protein
LIPHNKPLKSTGHHKHHALLPQVPCLPLRGGVGLADSS